MAVIIDSKCKKCGGTITSDGGNPKCINCGYEPLEMPAPDVLKQVRIVDVVEKRPDQLQKRRQWYKKHKAEIKADIAQLGFRPAAEKWGYPYQMTGLFSDKRRVKKALPAEDQKVDHKDRELPGLPVFTDSWPENVQIKWLEVWQASRRRA
jgi:hypothetical protein